jgi:WhiB family redox-sensing transcriptional regulator
VELALCAQTDPDLFFPEKGVPSGPARRICAQCDVRKECLGEALLRPEQFGVSGGLTSSARKALLAKAGLRA